MIYLSMAEKETNDNIKVIHKHHTSGGGNAVYCLGVVGAAIYFIQQATSFWEGVIGLGKAIIWPAYLVYTALQYFQL